jgi:glycerol uptake facilitator-like aquaporin
MIGIEVDQEITGGEINPDFTIGETIEGKSKAMKVIVEADIDQN